MEILLNVGLFVVALAVLLKASDWFINSAEQIGLAIGISPFIIGVTLIAFGTSLPELATSISSVYADASSIVVGNVVGSNITNILLVLSLTVLFGREILIEHNIFDVDLPILLGSSLLLFFMLQDGSETLIEMSILIVGMIVYLASSFSTGRIEKKARRPASWKAYAMLVVGGTLVYFGADYTIHSIVNLSSLVGISEEVIALTVVALGTSLPEVVVSISAVKMGKASIAVGNVIGSNVFNTFAVMGIPRLFGNLEIPSDVISFGLPFMVCVTILFLFICISKRISKWEAMLMIMFYILYISILVEKQF